MQSNICGPRLIGVPHPTLPSFLSGSLWPTTEIRVHSRQRWPQPPFMPTRLQPLNLTSPESVLTHPSLTQHPTIMMQLAFAQKPRPWASAAPTLAPATCTPLLHVTPSVPLHLAQSPCLSEGSKARRVGGEADPRLFCTDLWVVTRSPGGGEAPAPQPPFFQSPVHGFSGEVVQWNLNMKVASVNKRLLFQ